ncbi:MAG: NAD(P)-dependent oxidoreductase [Planctomycetota bacterium]|nr:NAD(P)-dependent oxidoreductase [Planctomycetota bacterium]
MTSPAPVAHVGYIGLGIMGSAMAANLIKAGFKLTVWNRTAARAQPLVALGATLAASPADLAARKPDVICVNVTDTPDVEAVLFGADGIASKAAPGLIVVDHSTISPVATQDFAARLAKQGVTLLDAPVSGGDVGARNATLSIMVGGPEDAFVRCKPLFEAMGKAITHMGPSGMGQACKACNQVAVSVTLLGVCEAMALAQKCGLDVRKMIQVVSAGAGGSWQLANLGPRIAGGDMAPGFMIDLVLKDLAIVGDTARARMLPLPATAMAEACFRSVAAAGSGRLGTQAISQAVEKLGHFTFVKKD